MKLRVGMALLVLLSAFVAGPSSAGSLAPTGSTTLPPIACPDELAPGHIATIAGGGSATGDGGLALEARIDVSVGGLAVDDDGTLHFTGYYGPGVRRVGIDGVVATLADAPMVTPAGLEIASDGTLVVADAEAGRIWRVAADATVSVVAGSGSDAGPGSGDSGPATDAAVHPWHVEIGEDGSIYFDDVPRYRVIGPDGIVRAFAGSEEAGFAGDGGPAIAALLGGADPSDRSYPDVEGSAIDATGAVFLTDNANSRIRKVDPDGIISTVAGSGERGYTGDGGPALEATFQDPVDLAFDDAGNLYISDHHNSAVRKLDTAGIVTTVAGGGHNAGASADCGPATEASIQPWAIAVHGGHLFIGDMGSSRIRVVRL